MASKKIRGRISRLSIFAVLAITFSVAVSPAVAQEDTTPPTAVLSAPPSIVEGATLVLRGNLSQDSESAIVRYTWTRLQGQGGGLSVNGSIATTVSTLSLPRPGRSPLQPGLHRFRLVVMDAAGNVSAPRFANVTVVGNSPPTAVLSAPTSISAGQNLTLNGSQSSVSGNGNIIRYIFTHIQGQGGMPLNVPIQRTSPLLNVPMSGQPPLAAGQHRFRLVVRDSAGNDSGPVVRVVTVTGDTTPPVARLSMPATVNAGQNLTLNGSQSSDSGGNIIRYTFTHIQGQGGMPLSVPIQRNSPLLNVPLPGQQPLATGVHRFRLVVTDGAGNQSAPVVRNVTVAGDTTPPVARLTMPTSIGSGQNLTLNGSTSNDPGGGNIVRYTFTHIQGQGGMPLNAPIQRTSPLLNVPLPGQPPLASGQHRFRLVVRDAAGNDSNPVVRTVNVAGDTTAPTAVLDAPAQISAGQNLTLSGSRSSDPGGGSIVRYTFTHIQGQGGMPLNAPVARQTPVLNVPLPGQPPLATGVHRFRLVVRDASGNESQPAILQMRVLGDTTRPTAVLTAPSQINVGQSLTLDAGRSRDVGGRIVRYSFTKIQGQGGMPVNSPIQTQSPRLNVPMSGQPPLAIGQHRFRLVVTDDSGNESLPAEFQMRVLGDTTAPTAVLTAPTQINVGQSLTLDAGRSRDVGGRIVRYTFTKVQGQGGMRPNSPVQTQSPRLNVPMSGQPPLAIGQHRFRLVVTDDSGNQSQPADFQVRVLGDTTPPTAVLQAPPQINAGQPLVLNAGRSSDQGGRIVRYTYTHIQGRGGMPTNRPIQVGNSRITLPLSGNPPLAAGEHRFRLVVTDDAGNNSRPAEIRVRVVAAPATPPTAVLQAPPQINAGQSLVLNAGRSSATGGRIVAYTYTQTQGRGGMPTNRPMRVGNARITLPLSGNPPLAAGEHRFRLVVTDNAGISSRPAEIRVRVVGDTTPPTAVIGAPKTINFGQALKFDASRSTDKGGKIVQYRWVHRSGKGGKMKPGRPVSTKITSFVVPQDRRAPLLAGRHVFELTVVDAAGNVSKPARAIVTVRPPARR